MSKRNLESKDVLHLGVKKILVPGLIDTHIHAPQYAFAGTIAVTLLVKQKEVHPHSFSITIRDALIHTDTPPADIYINSF